MKCTRLKLIKQSPVSLLYYPSEPKLTKETPINITENIGKIKKGVTLSISLTILQSDPGCSVLNHPALINALVTTKKNNTPQPKATAAIQSFQLYCIYRVNKMCVQHILPYPWSLTATFLALYPLRASERMLKIQVLLKSWTKSFWFKTL